jgi:tRNA nucleotidyltransferase (CCA-adding enzyme)
MSDTNKILQHCLNDDLRQLRKLFQHYGFDLRIVGGAVRDIMCGQTPKDIDLCTNAYPDEAIKIYTDQEIRFEPTGIDHGTISVIMNGETYEITSLRYDTETDGRHAKVTFTRLWYEDLARRDLTINAMSMSFDGVLDDPYGGRDDLQNNVVQFVGDAGARIQEDYLRILRYFRFAGRFGNERFRDDQIAAVTTHASGLKQVSRERVWQEVGKMMTHTSAPIVYEAMDSTGVLEHADLPLLTKGVLTAMTIAVHHTKNAASVFSTLFDTIEKVEEYGKKLKISTKDIRHMKTMVKLQNVSHIDDFKFAVVLDGVSLEDAIEAATMHGDLNIASQLKAWTVPVFPVTGDDLIALGMKPGKIMGSTLVSAKYTWFTIGQQNNEVYADKEQVLSVIKEAQKLF